MADKMPHGQERRSRFDRFAEWATQVASGGTFFAVCSLLVVLWLPTLILMDVEASQIMVQTVTAIVTFLLVALLQNSQKRNEEAMNRKLSAIAQGVADLMRERTGDDQDLRDNIAQLTDTVGLEERTTTDRRSPREADDAGEKEDVPARSG